MRRLGAVQQKIPCVFITEVQDEPSSKREHQSFKVVATETLNPLAVNADIQSALPTEKVDGTCCYVATHKGVPYLWARLDRKPTKQAEKRFKRYLRSNGSSKEFVWNVDEDFKSVSDFWIPAKEVKHCNGKPYPDGNGHMPENGNKQYCWHSRAVNYERGVAIVLRPNAEDPGCLEICLVSLSEILEQTLELIGTNINGNPYGIGSKKNPFHLLVPHGVFQIKDLPPLKHNSLVSWFDSCHEGKVEGIVWHCSDGSLIKLHRHHLGLRWPIPDSYLNTRPVTVSVNVCESEFAARSLTQLSKDTHRFDRLQDIFLDV
ncbi:hypothetical protein FKM82_012519 [Ascaphus truei]